MPRVHIAWPWELGGLGPAPVGPPTPPAGYVFLVDDSGLYLTDDIGTLLLVEE